MTTWLTSDHHFSHKKVLKLCNRPFGTIDEHDAALIDAWNKVVKPDDSVYHLGDFTLSGRSDAERFFLRLNGHIHVLGNPWHHDSKWLNKQYYLSAQHYQVIIEPPIIVLEDVEQINGRGIPAILCHYAFSRWDRRHYGSYHFFGHSHGKYNPGGRSLDVGVDSAYAILGEYRPFELNEAIEIAQSNHNAESTVKRMEE